MPVVHVVTFTFAADILEQVTGTLRAALDDLAPKANALFYQHGPDIRIRAGNAHYAVTAIFADRQTFQAYVDSAEHQQLIRDHVRPYLQSRSAVQYDLAPDRLSAAPYLAPPLA
jgi:hypothetical protein